jgi:hypothetical protein
VIGDDIDSDLRTERGQYYRLEDSMIADERFRSFTACRDFNDRIILQISTIMVALSVGHHAVASRLITGLSVCRTNDRI